MGVAHRQVHGGDHGGVELAVDHGLRHQAAQAASWFWMWSMFRWARA